MDDGIPSLSGGAVGSRFVSQSELDTAKERREEQWKAAYARPVAEPQKILLPQLTLSLRAQTRPRTATAARRGCI